MNFYGCFAVIGIVLIWSGSCSICKISPKVIYSTIGSPVNITCNLTVDRMYVAWLGPLNLTHYAQGNSITKKYSFAMKIIGNAKERQHILQIVKMQETNEGLYKCTAVGGEHCFQLVIQKPPRNMTINGSNNKNVIYGFLNQQMSLTCDVEIGTPPESMSWEFEHKIVAKGGPGSITHMFILNVTDHFKTYRCIAYNNVTKTNLTKEVSLFLYFEPTVKIVPSGTIDIIEDEMLLLECNYTSNDNANTSITWYYTSNDQIQYINKTAKLKIEKIKRIHSGKYTCMVSNSAGRAEDMVNVSVLYSPSVHIHLYNQQSVTVLNCTAHGNPDDYVFSSWEHKTEYGDHIRFLKDNGRGCIELPNSSEEIDRYQDQGIYTCSVSNGVLYHGQTNRFDSYNLKRKGLPYFAASSNTIQYGILGQETNLTLNVISYPKITSVSVYKNQTMVMTDVKIEMELSKIEDIIYGQKVNVKGYTLLVPIVIATTLDFMTYTICVFNELGQRNFSIDIKSASEPMRPTQLKAIPGVHTIKLTWEKGFDGGFVQSFEIEYKKSGSDNWTVEIGFMLNDAIISGLQPDTYFRLRVFSRNCLGRSNSSDEIVVKTGKQLEVSSSYTAIYVSLPLLIILIIACGTLVYHYKKEPFIRNVDLSCFQWTYGRNAVGGQGVENGIYDMQNNVAPVPDAQSSDPPVYSSIDRKHNLSIGQSVSYSVAKKKKPNPLGARYRNKGKQHVETETDIEMSTSETGENLQLNYVDVCFDPKPVGHQFKIHGMDQKSEYVDIDFSKSINILPDSEKLHGSDEDFSSVEDVIAMKRDMMI